MHKRQLNHARLGVVIRPRGPILIKSGLETPDPTRPGMEFVRTRHSDLGDTVYLPGTSLKGALRSHAERVLRGLGVEACDPLAKHSPCRELQRGEDSALTFTKQCVVCRTFGSLAVAGRVNVLDAYPWPADADPAAQAAAAAVANATEGRWQVGIDRRTAQPHGGVLYDLELVVNGKFYTELVCRNFQLWQLGLLAAMVQEMNAGYLPIGFGKSRGLGQVAVELGTLQLTAATAGDHPLRGVAALATPEEHEAYGLYGDDVVELSSLALQDLAGELRQHKSWRGVHLTADGAQRHAILEAVVRGPLASFLKARRGNPARGARDE